MKKLATLLVIVVVAVGIGFLLRSAGPDGLTYKSVAVKRGPVRDTLRETGVVNTRDPALVKAPVRGTIEWIVEDGQWVDEGDRLYVINVDEAMKAVSATRSAMLTTQQELALARMRRRHARQLEDTKVAAVRRDLNLKRVRHQILATEPQGGTRLIEIHEQLRPLERKSARVRDAYEQVQGDYQQAHDVYVEKLDRWQASRDAILRLQTRSDEFVIRAEAKVDETKPDQVRQRQEVMTQLAEAQRQIEQLRTDQPALERAYLDARAKRDLAKAPRDKLLAELEQVEAREKELYVQLEIEKRGVERARLQFERQAVELTWQAQQRKLTAGQEALARGAVSKGQVEKLQSDLAAAGNELNVLDEKIKISGRPPPEALLTEARMKAEQAAIALAEAEAAADRALAALDQEITLLDAQMARAQSQLDQESMYLPKIVEFRVKLLKSELATLDSAQAQRRDESEQQLADLEAQLERFRDDPPHIGRAKVSGVIKLARRWGRARQAGDRLDHDFMVLMEIHPPLNLEIRTSINEANVRLVAAGLPVQVTVPSLAGRQLRGKVAMVGGIGKDKYADRVHDENPVFAGVTHFDARIELDQVPADLRPGMMVVLAVDISQEQDVLHLPRAAVRRLDDQFTVLTGAANRPAEKAVSGRLFGDDVFVIDTGLTEGDVVFIDR